MITQDDLDKLKLLANNTKEYFDVLLVKLRENAINNGHNMSIWWPYWTGPSMIEQAHCKNCGFGIDVEYFEESEKIYFDILKVNQKCIGNYKKQKRLRLKRK